MSQASTLRHLTDRDLEFTAPMRIEHSDPFGECDLMRQRAYIKRPFPLEEFTLPVAFDTEAYIAPQQELEFQFGGWIKNFLLSPAPEPPVYVVVQPEFSAHTLVIGTHRPAEFQWAATAHMLALQKSYLDQLNGSYGDEADEDEEPITPQSRSALERALQSIIPNVAADVMEKRAVSAVYRAESGSAAIMIQYLIASRAATIIFHPSGRTFEVLTTDEHVRGGTIGPFPVDNDYRIKGIIAWVKGSPSYY